MKKKIESMCIPAEAFFKYVSPDEIMHSYSLWVTDQAENTKKLVCVWYTNPVKFYYGVLNLINDKPDEASNMAVVIKHYFDYEIVGRLETPAVDWLRTFHENYDFTDDEVERYRPC